MKKSKLDKSWNEQAFLYAKENQELKEAYLKGANDFQNQILSALENFSLMTNAEIFQDGVDTYFKTKEAIDDLSVLVSKLYAPIKSKQK